MSGWAVLIQGAVSALVFFVVGYALGRLGDRQAAREIRRASDASTPDPG